MQLVSGSKSAGGTSANNRPTCPIESDRLWESIMAMAEFGGLPGGGCARLSLSDEDRAPRDQFVRWCRDARCEVCLSTIKSGHIGGAARRELGGKESAQPVRRRARTAHPSPRRDACACLCTTTFENAHRTVLREVLYRHHPWFGRRVCVHETVEKADDLVFRCTLDGSQAERWREVPAWMFDRMAWAEAEPLAAQPFVSIDALAALSALLDLALKDRTPSVALLSGASRASHDENRGETHVTRDGNARERI